MMNNYLPQWLSISLFVSLFSCTSPEVKETGLNSTNVGIEVIKSSVEVRTLQYFGISSSESIVSLSFKVNGIIENISAKKGDKVYRGQSLFKIQSQEYALALRSAHESFIQARYEAEESERYLSKIHRMYEIGNVSKADYDKSKLDNLLKQSALKQAEINEQNVKLQIKDTNIFSTVDGIIVDMHARSGEMINAGTPVVSIRTLTDVIQTGVIAEDFQQINLGQKVIVDFNDQKIQGIVKMIVPYPDSSTDTYPVQIFLNNSNDLLPIGSLVRVNFEMGKESGMFIPIQIIQSDGENYVYIIKNGRAIRQYIRLLNNYENRVRVTGLKDGDSLIIKGHRLIRDGSKVNAKT